MKNVLGSKIEELESEAKVTIPLKDYRMLTLIGSEGEAIKEKVMSGISIAIGEDYSKHPRIEITNNFTSLFTDYTLKALSSYAISNPDAMAVLVTRGEHYFDQGCLSDYDYGGDSNKVDLLDNPVFKAAWDKEVVKYSLNDVQEPEVIKDTMAEELIQFNQEDR